MKRMQLSFNRLRAAACVLGLAAGLVLTGCISVGPPAGITPVTPFDAALYQGRWYEIARLDHRFERGLSDVSATYESQSDGSIRVVNRGFDPSKGTSGGDWSEREGVAKFVGPSNVGSLRVSFFGPFYGGYHVAALDPAYQWALVVGPDRDNFWILARSAKIAPELRAQLLQLAEASGIDTKALIWVTHDRASPR